MRTGGDIGHMLSGRATRRHFKGVHCMRWEDAQRSRVPAQLGTAHHLIARFACMNGMQLRCQTRVVSWVNCRLCTRESAGDHQHLAWHISWLDAVHRVRVPARESKRSARTEVGARDSLNLGCACGACTPDPTEEPRDKTGHVASCLHGCVALSTTLQEVGHCMVMHWRTRSTACAHIQRAPRSLKHLLFPQFPADTPALRDPGANLSVFRGVTAGQDETYADVKKARNTLTFLSSRWLLQQLFLNPALCKVVKCMTISHATADMQKKADSNSWQLSWSVGHQWLLHATSCE